MSDDTDAGFDNWLRSSTGRAEPVAPEPSPDVEGVRFPGFGSGTAAADHGARSPASAFIRPSTDDGFKALMQQEVDGQRYGGRPEWR